MDLKAEIGRRIGKARTDKGKDWTLKVVAELSGLTPSQISNYEHGRREPGVFEAKKLAAALGVSAAYLLCVDDESGLPEEEKRLLGFYRRSDDRGRITIMAVAEAQEKPHK